MILKRGLALLVMVDGTLTALSGKSFLRWLRALLPDQIDPMVNWFIGWPSLLLRMGATVQAVVGLMLLLRAR
ncbi:MAG: hypothetical protein GXY36_08260 [Chloroflexi bacterium]|nr:hypothetical protein [Chloroflexota bacterium]